MQTLVSTDTIHHLVEEVVAAGNKVTVHATETGHTTQESSGELPNIITLLNSYFHDSPIVHFLHHFENQIFSLMIAVIIIVIAYLATRKSSLIPYKLQNLIEMIVEGLDDLVRGIIGPRGSKYTPFVGTLFVYILIMNLAGLIPFLKSPTSSLNTTLGLAICVFVYVQWNGIKENGIIGYLDHLAGQPRDGIGWGMVILMFPLHILEELIKPVSLSLRLFGNILGEDLLIGAFVGLGIMALSIIHSPVGLPLHFPFLLLAMLTSTVQALVFTLLSTIYIFLMLPHEEHAH